MKKELIKTNNYLLVVDESEIKTWYYDEYSKKVHHSGNAAYSRNDITKNIVAHLPLNGYGILEGVPLLPPLDDDIKKLNEDLFDKGSDNVLHPQYQMRTFFNMGYNKAREKYKFTEEDAKYFFECGRNFQINADITFTVAREHLSQPKTPTHFEFETEITHEGNGTYSTDLMDIGLSNLTPIKVIKTTTNLQGQVVACGKYIY